MYPHLLYVPAYILALICGGVVAASLAAGWQRLWITIVGGVVGGAAALGVAFSQPWGQNAIPVQGYGFMILSGFALGVWMAARRARRIGVDPKHCLDVSILGVIFGLLGARAFHVAMHWPIYDPTHAGGFDFDRVKRMFALWEGGLVFFGAFLTVLPMGYFYCRHFKLNPLRMLDLTAPCIIAGHAVGRVGCFLNGCCFGAQSSAPWAVQFPKGSPPYDWQLAAQIINENAPCSLSVHPSQIYAAIAAGLTSAFLYSYWPRRRFDGEVLGLMLMMVGTTRFFEELLRSDESAAFPALSATLTIAQWLTFPIVLTGATIWTVCRIRAARAAVQ